MTTRLRAFVVALLLLAASGVANAQADSSVCKNQNTTILLVRLSTGFRLVFLLQRDGDAIRGRVNGWQATGVTAGVGNVSGSFAGTAPVGRGLVLEVRWEADRSRGARDTYYKGFLHNGKGRGTALDLATSRPVEAFATTLSDCPEWPEQSSLTPPGPQPVEPRVDRPGSDYRNFDVAAGELQRCRAACIENAQCRAYTFVRPGVQGPSARCWLKNAVPAPQSNDCCTSGVVRGPLTGAIGDTLRRPPRLVQPGGR